MFPPILFTLSIPASGLNHSPINVNSIKSDLKNRISSIWQAFKNCIKAVTEVAFSIIKEPENTAHLRDSEQHHEDLVDQDYYKDLVDQGYRVE